MALLLVLNEHSYSGLDSTRDQISPAVYALVKVIKCVRRHRKDSVLNRDAARYLKNLQQRSPFQGVAPAHLDGIVEYHFDGRPAAGLGLAHLVGGLSVSLPLRDWWDSEFVELERIELDEDTTNLVNSTVTVRHASGDQHVTAHQRWLCNEGLAHGRSGDDLWKVCDDMFPNLVFLPRVEQDLAGIRDYWLEPVKERLAELQMATARWDVSNVAEPQWSSRITPESASRKRLCHFTDLDRTVQVFDMHARFTPGAGRLHFRVDRAKQRLVIAYVGPKIERPQA